MGWNLKDVNETFWSQWSDTELQNIAQIKRFNELKVGDKRFRTLLSSGDCSNILFEISNEPDWQVFDLELKDIRPLWDPDYAADDEAKQFPLVMLWTDFILKQRHHVLQLRMRTSDSNMPPDFKKWRERQINRCMGELNPYTASALPHQILIFELSDGCSVGCSFCGVDALRFNNHYDYTIKREEWRGVISTMKEMFGDAVQQSSCYLATEPFDNPNYLDFVADFQAIVGVLPGTTTALSTKKPEMTRALIEMAEESGTGHPKLSILTRKQLVQLHKLYSPHQLLKIRLQNVSSETTAAMVSSGRALGREFEDSVGETIVGATGFVINLVRQDVKLISPCVASNANPMGYIELATRKFSDPNDLKDQMETIIENSCIFHLFTDPNCHIEFRPDISIEDLENGFEIVCAGRGAKIQGHQGFRALASHIQSGKHNLEGLCSSMAPHGISSDTIRSMVFKLSHEGFLSETHLQRRI